MSLVGHRCVANGCLADICGAASVLQVHQGLAEQSFRHQVQTIMGDGQLTKERAEALAGAHISTVI